MKVAVTGHTKGIGKAIVDYFESKGHECIGFSRSNGYDISNELDRQRIITESQDADIFVNNAYVKDGQYRLLVDIYKSWTGTTKTIFNVSSNATNSIGNPFWPYQEYSKDKKQQDDFCRVMFHKNPTIVNLKPGTVDTEMTKGRLVRKMTLEDFIKVFDFIISNQDKFRIRSITFTP